MGEIVWTQEMSVGVERLDAEHKMLVAMLNELGQALASGRGDKAARDVAERMRLYAKEHFQSEESAMLASDYPTRTGHIAEHDSFIEKVLDLEDRLGQGGAAEPEAIRDYLADWLRRHIMGTDKALGAHLAAQAPQ